MGQNIFDSIKANPTPYIGLGINIVSGLIGSKEKKESEINARLNNINQEEQTRISNSNTLTSYYNSLINDEINSNNKTKSINNILILTVFVITVFMSIYIYRYE